MQKIKSFTFVILFGIAVVGVTPAPANAIIISYTDYTDFQSTTITSDVGANISTSGNYTTNSAFGSNSGDPGAFTSNNIPMEFSGFSAFEIGMTFGNDENIFNSSGFFNANLSIFDGATLLGGVVVASNGNDLADQFIGLSSDTAFNTVTLSYGAGSGSLSIFINRIDIGYDAVLAVPEPSTLALFPTGLAALAFLGWRRRRSVRLKSG